MERSVIRGQPIPDYAALTRGYGQGGGDGNVPPADRSACGTLTSEYGGRRAPLIVSYGRRCLRPASPPDRGGPDRAGTENMPPQGPPDLLVPKVYQACPSARAGAARRMPHRRFEHP